MADEDIMVEFIVDEEEPQDLWVTFRRFIREVRDHLAGLGDRRTHGLIVLPEERKGKPPIRWLNVLLRSNQHGLSIRLRIRVDNLYLVGFQLHGSDEWFEIGEAGGGTTTTTTHMIFGSTIIECGCNYHALAKTAGKSVGNTHLGQEPLVRAISNLNTLTDLKNRAQNLIVIIVMICEAVRFKSVSTYLTKQFTATPPPHRLIYLIRDWKAYSSMLQEADSNPEFVEPRQSKLFETFQDIARALAVVKYRCFPPPPPPRPPLFCTTSLNNNNNNNNMDNSTTVDDDDEGQYCLLGKPLVEVFGVYVVTNIDGGELYGTVTIWGSLISQYLYHRKKDDYESIDDRNKTALLIGPVQSIWAYDCFSIDVDLMDNKDDQVISKGDVYWDDNTDAYDTVLSKDVHGEYGSVIVWYIVFRDAFEATVEVTLVNGDGEDDPANVYGDLTARTTNIANESVLFRKSSSETINVKPGGHIPLSRCVVAVPSNSSLIVRADLWDDHDKSSSDDQIAKGTAEFPAHLSGSYEKHIKGPRGDIKVKVTWSNS